MKIAQGKQLCTQWLRHSCVCDSLLLSTPGNYLYLFHCLINCPFNIKAILSHWFVSVFTTLVKKKDKEKTKNWLLRSRLWLLLATSNDKHTEKRWKNKIKLLSFLFASKQVKWSHNVTFPTEQTHSRYPWNANGFVLYCNYWVNYLELCLFT